MPHLSKRISSEKNLCVLEIIGKWGNRRGEREDRTKDGRELKKEKRQEKDRGYQKGERKHIFKDRKKDTEWKPERERETERGREGMCLGEAWRGTPKPGQQRNCAPGETKPCPRGPLRSEIRRLHVPGAENFIRGLVLASPLSVYTTSTAWSNGRKWFSRLPWIFPGQIPIYFQELNSQGWVPPTAWTVQPLGIM